jgi:hypothetical protein
VNPTTRLGASELLSHKSFCDLTNEKSNPNGNAIRRARSHNENN